MRSLLALAVLTGWAQASVLEINAFDQEKLAQLLNRLPQGVLHRTVTDAPGVRTITNVFPRAPGPFQISCESPFYDGSPYPSTPVCEVAFDDNDRAIEKKYDEWRIQETDPEVIQALFAAIAPRGETRYYRSGYSDEGTNFEGRRTNIFHYLVSCTSSSCVYHFSEKKIH